MNKRKKQCLTTFTVRKLHLILGFKVGFLPLFLQFHLLDIPMPLPARLENLPLCEQKLCSWIRSLKNPVVLLSLHIANCVFRDLNYSWAPLHALQFPRCYLNGIAKSQKWGSSNGPSSAVFRSKVHSQIIPVLPLVCMQTSHQMPRPQHWNRSVKRDLCFLVTTSTNLCSVSTTGLLCTQIYYTALACIRVHFLGLWLITCPSSHYLLSHSSQWHLCSMDMNHMFYGFLIKTSKDIGTNSSRRFQ